MKIFESLDKVSNEEMESKILKKWKSEDILNKTIENRKNCKNFVFYDGPATANGKPGIHHMLAKELKDTFCKYKNMKGYRVVRKVGWDTHGLPVELQVEKELGFSGKKDIEKYGIKEFNEKCREAVRANEKAFTDLTDKMGQFIDCEHPYVTCSNEYIESEWWIIKEMDKKGLLYHGNKVLWYCPRCGTELSQNEVSQGYEETSVNTVIVPLKRVDADEYFLAWTTTPWTLMANVAICVNPELTYIKVLSQGYKFILAESLANKVLGDDYEVLETYKGSELVGIKYEQLMPFVKVEGKCHEVIADGYVTAEDGTGIVHLAPAFGADDANVGRKYNLPYLNPVGEDGKYIECPWKDLRVFDADIEIIKYLNNQNIETIDLSEHNSAVDDYPLYAFEVGKAVSSKEADYGILLCGTGIGMSIAANKVKGIRCAHVTSNTEAMLARAHNNANIIALGANNHKVNDLIKWIDLFLTTDFKNEERHVRRNKQIMEYEQK